MDSKIGFTDLVAEDPDDAPFEVVCPEAVFALEEGTLVPPGTAKLEVTPTWPRQWPQDPAGLVEDPTGATLAYMPADRQDFVDADGARGSGESWVLPLDRVTMADPGHSEATLWRFQLRICLPRPDARIQTMDVHLNLTATRVNGSLPLEPAHPDWWANETQRSLYEDQVAVDQTGTTPVWGYDPPGASPSAPLDTYNFSRYRISGTEHTMVPLGTEALVMEINWTNEADEPRARPYAYYSYDVGSGGDHDTRTPWEPAVEEPGRHVYELPVTDEMTDGLYPVNRSRWWFQVYFAGEDTGLRSPLPYGDPVTLPYRFEGTWSVEIWAVESIG